MLESRIKFFGLRPSYTSMMIMSNEHEIISQINVIGVVDTINERNKIKQT